MPVVRDPYPPSLPAWLHTLLAELETSPLQTAVKTTVNAGAPPLRVGGKAIWEYLGEILTPRKKARGVPRRLEFGAFNPGADLPLRFHDVETWTPFDASLADFKRLIESGALEIDAPPSGDAATVRRITRKIRSALPKPKP